MKPQASIVVPLLRQPLPWLMRCVRSALDQTVPTEVIVVVSPLTPSVLGDALADLRLVAPGLSVMPESGTGFAAALNTGIRAATSDRVGFLLADDWLEPSAVAVCLQHAADIVSTGMAFWHDDGTTPLGELHRRPTQERFESLPSIERRASYLEHFFLFRREVLLAVGGVDESIGLTGADDFDLIWTLLERGASVQVLPDPLYNYRDHFGERLTLRDPALMRQDLARVLAKHGVPPDERERMLDEHAEWFGEPVHVVDRRLRARAQP